MLSKSSIQKLRAVKEAILAQPQYYSQNQWVQKVDKCGTTCCIAGWADFVFNGDKAHTERAIRLYNPNVVSDGMAEWHRVARTALSLTRAQTRTLTNPSYQWPYQFACRYRDATTPRMRARVAADRIEHFISTGGQE